MPTDTDPNHDSMFVRFEQLTKLLNRVRGASDAATRTQIDDAKKLVELIRKDVIK